MNTEREKIKELMDRLNFPAFNDWGYELMELFHNAVRNAALEEAALQCDETREIEDHWDGGTTTVHKYFYRDDCIAAILAMKETK